MALSDIFNKKEPRDFNKAQPAEAQKIHGLANLPEPPTPPPELLKNPELVKKCANNASITADHIPPPYDEEEQSISEEELDMISRPPPRTLIMEIDCSDDKLLAQMHSVAKGIIDEHGQGVIREFKYYGR